MTTDQGVTASLVPHCEGVRYVLDAYGECSCICRDFCFNDLVGIKCLQPGLELRLQEKLMNLST